MDRVRFGNAVLVLLLAALLGGCFDEGSTPGVDPADDRGVEELPDGGMPSDMAVDANEEPFVCHSDQELAPPPFRVPGRPEDEALVSDDLLWEPCLVASAGWKLFRAGPYWAMRASVNREQHASWSVDAFVGRLDRPAPRQMLSELFLRTLDEAQREVISAWDHKDFFLYGMQEVHGGVVYAVEFYSFAPEQGVPLPFGIYLLFVSDDGQTVRRLNERIVNGSVDQFEMAVDAASQVHLITLRNEIAHEEDPCSVDQLFAGACGSDQDLPYQILEYTRVELVPEAGDDAPFAFTPLIDDRWSFVNHRFARMQLEEEEPAWHGLFMPDGPLPAWTWIREISLFAQGEQPHLGLAYSHFRGLAPAEFGPIAVEPLFNGQHAWMPADQRPDWARMTAFGTAQIEQGPGHGEVRSLLGHPVPLNEARGVRFPQPDSLDVVRERFVCDCSRAAPGSDCVERELVYSDAFEEQDPVCIHGQGFLRLQMVRSPLATEQSPAFPEEPSTLSWVSILDVEHEPGPWARLEGAFRYLTPEPDSEGWILWLGALFPEALRLEYLPLGVRESFVLPRYQDYPGDGAAALPRESTVVDTHVYRGSDGDLCVLWAESVFYPLEEFPVRTPRAVLVRQLCGLWPQHPGIPGL